MGYPKRNTDQTNFLDLELRRLKNNNFYRTLQVVSKVESTRCAVVDGKQVSVHLCSNDYLGLSLNESVLRETVLGLNQISQCSSRLIAGNAPKLLELEAKLAEHRMTDCSLVYPTGYMANLGVLTTIADKETIILSDQLNHASIIDGCKLSGATVKIFRHNDAYHLEQLMYDIPSFKRKIVVLEGVFSMDGDLARLVQVCKVAKYNNAITIVDDAHGDFIFGKRSSHLFSGIPSFLGVNSDVDVHTSSLSKALGCFGGYVATTNLIREILINKSRQLIYTSALPEHLCASALASMTIAQKGNLQKKLFENIKFFGKKLRNIGLIRKMPISQIIPIIIGPEKLALKFSKLLLEDGVFLKAVRYPTVQKGSARLRISITALESAQQLKKALDSLETNGKKIHLI